MYGRFALYADPIALANRRCHIPADGYYEWQELANSKTKQPCYINLKNQQPMALAGLGALARGRRQRD
jgi:putative SOS response-associated peptidase YedK